MPNPPTPPFYKGFTLVELMITIAIVAILSTIGLTVYGNLQKQAKSAKVSEDAAAIIKAIQLIRIQKNDVLGHITGNFCSECAHCRPPNHTNDPQCIADMKAAYATVTPAEMPLDPWGGAYTWDENELEPGYIVCCVNPPLGNANTYQDFMSSGGPNHTIYLDPNSIHISIPPMFCTSEKAVADPNPPNACVCTPGFACAT